MPNHGSFIFGKSLILLSGLCLLLQAQTRREIHIPDIPDYITLKCDFHMHTPFSDGTVWPPDRVTEAWVAGLDAIAITDHVEYHAYESDVKIKPNRSYELALPKARELGILLVHGAEITRDMPPGHFNALFIQNDSVLTIGDPMKAIEAAARQNAFVFWNHPGWRGQQPDGIARWYDAHTHMYEKGWLKGIEIVNEKEFYPDVFQWAIDKNLTLFGNSDVHSPIAFLYDSHLNQHRPLTLVFATDRTLDGLREALEARRTAVYHEDKIYGHEAQLSVLFNKMVEIRNSLLSMDSAGKTYLQLHNHSDLPLRLINGNGGINIGVPGEIELPPHLTILVPVTLKDNTAVYKQITLSYTVENLQIGPGKPLPVQLNLKTLRLSALSIKKVYDKGTYRFESPVLPEGIKIVYTFDGSTPTLLSQTINKEFKVDGNAHLKIAAFSGNQRIGDIIEHKLKLHAAFGISGKFTFQPNSKYTGNGGVTLTDGIFASLDFGDGNWLGFESDNFEAGFDMGKMIFAQKISLRFLEDQKSWIFLPRVAEISISADGLTFQPILTQQITIAQSAQKKILTIDAELKDKKFRFVRINAENVKTCPEWHSGAGGKAWLFTDEMVIE